MINNEYDWKVYKLKGAGLVREDVISVRFLVVAVEDGGRELS